MSRNLIFSVSTSFYKRVDWVEHVYESLKKQTYPYWEWVVTDDFSEDKCAEEKLRALSKEDSRITYYNQSRKRELFYNPQYGCSGDIVMQLDCDDIIYDNLLEIYNKYFSEDTELMGITCGHLMMRDLVKFVSVSSFSLEDKHNITWAQMGRAWRNIIPHFDLNGDLKDYQNDTNMWRQIEARGKVMFLPRELYVYNYNSVDSISSVVRGDQSAKELEDERQWMEGRFPMLDKGDRCTFDLKYLPIDKVAWAFYTCEFNKSTSPKNVLFIKADIKAYEKQLLSELFYDHSIDFNVEKREVYDEIVVYLNDSTFRYLEDNFMRIRETFKGVGFRFFIDTRVFDFDSSKISLFGGWSFWTSGPLHYGYLSL